MVRSVGLVMKINQRVAETGFCSRGKPGGERIAISVLVAIKPRPRMCEIEKKRQSVVERQAYGDTSEDASIGYDKGPGNSSTHCRGATAFAAKEAGHGCKRCMRSGAETSFHTFVENWLNV